MNYTIHDPKLGPITHSSAGLYALRRRLWQLAESGVEIAIEADRDFALDRPRKS